METQVSSPVLGSLSSPTSRSRSSSKLVDDVTSLTSFNPFSEEDENDQSSYTLVTSLFSRMKNTLSAPLSSAVTAASTSTNPATSTNVGASEQRRPSYTLPNSQSTFSSKYSVPERSKPFPTIQANPAPPLVSLTPAHSEFPTFHSEHSRSPPRGAGGYPPAYDPQDGGQYGTAIPGFPVVDDARSIKTSTSHHRSGSVSKVIRRIRGEGLSRDYWMDDENCKECYDCKSLFTTWRRKHHCRICGQIFCSRCASNIIKGTRFNHDGMVRVCNLCLDKLAKVDDDDDDDRRSFVSSVHSFPAHQLGNGNDPFSAYHPHSPFSASQIFGRTDEPFNLYSIAETKRYASRSDEDLGRVSFPALQEREDGVWEPIRETPAPFRRALADEEKDTSDIPTHFVSDSPAGGPGTPLDFPSAAPVNPDAPMSSIQFPMGSPERGLDSPRSQSRLRSRFDSYGDFDVATPFIRSRVQSRLDTFLGEVGWRTRRESTAYAQELNLTSMLHLKIMLRQMLTTEQIPNVKEWEETLLKLALRIAKELTFTTHPHRQGEDMDVRRYVKIKKLPGGSPQDSEYVDGAVITKNVAHKKMQRSLQNPRIMLITFPLEFHRVEGQYMHFGQIVRQEKEYLGNLASRIAALLPHIVLVEKSVSRLALDALAQYNIAVARMVKPSAISTVARMSQGDLFSSMDKLAFEPRLGHCARYRIQTFDHPLIPGRRKTLMRFEGCSRDMGCTIILRGENIETLRKIKKVTRFLTFIVRNLKLETHLWKDSVITLPAFNPEAIPNSPGEGRPVLMNLTIPSLLAHSAYLSTPRLSTPTLQLNDSGPISDVLPHDEEHDEVDEQLNLTWRIDQSLEPYQKTFISVSATLRFPPPYPIRRMKELDVQLHEAKRAWEDEIVRREEKLHSRHAAEGTITPVTITDTVGHNDATVPSLNLSVTTPSNDENATPTMTADDGYFAIPLGSGTSSVFPTSAGLSALATPMLEETVELMKTEADITLESRYTLIKLQHEEERRIWEWYLRKNSDDFVVEKYQCISLWEYTIPIAEFGLHRACFPPRLNYITFYGENDCTLGQFIEKSISDTLVEFLNPKAICTGKGCDQPLARHCKVYVHQETRLFVAVEQWDGQIIGRSNYPPSPDLITTWSVCRKCGSATPFIPVSEEMQRYSFAKFLELHFYPADVKLVLGAGCEHNIYQHHIRYFASKGMTLRFQTDPVVLHEIVYPPVRIRVRPETQLELKNKDFDRLHRRNILWYSALIDDLRLISIDAATGDEEMDEKLLAEVNTLITRAEEEREEISQFINRLYRDSSPTDTLALNPVYSFRQDKIVAWQQDFDKLPKPRPVQEKIISEKAYKKTSAFGTVRAAMWPKKPGLPLGFDNPHVPSSSVSEAEEVSPTSRRGKTKVDNFTSSASETSEVEPDTTSAESSTKIDPKEGEPIVLEPPVINESPVEAKHPAQGSPDPESDSTIGATQEDAALPERPLSDAAQTVAETDAALPASKLPRRPSNQPSVAELVRKYSDYLPAQGVQELAKTAFPPRALVSESEQEYPSIPPIRNTRSKSRRLPTKKPSISDFEQGYTANVAPLYLTHSRRSLGSIPHNSRIPGPIVSAFESVRSRDSSRRASPEKRSVGGKAKEVRFNQPGSPPHGRAPSGKLGKSKLASRTTPIDKPQLRSTSTSTPKSALRRPVGTPGGKVSNIARHFERIGRETERSKSRYAVIRGKKARPVASARAKVKILDSIKDAVQDDESEGSNSSSEADDEGEGDEDRNEHGKPSLPPAVQSTPDSEPQIEESAKTAPTDTFPDPPLDPAASENTAELRPPRPLTTISLPPSPFLAAMKNRSVSTPPPADFDIGGTAGNSFLKAISYFLPPQPVSRWALENELVNDPEHIFRDSSMVVRTDEPTSIIALALNSPQYREMLTKSRAEKRTAQQARLTEGGEVFMPDDRSVAESTSTWGVVNVDVADSADPTEDLRVPSSKLPWAITFESGGLTISCTVLYPEQFDALRRTYDCERSMVESLARCVKWNANGGKSGSAFLKTRDDRFIAKEISRPELQTMETFAPAYFDYMSSAVSANRPTLLAKVFGCYKLTFRKTTGKDTGPERSKSTQMNLLVMENLFYDRRFAKIYDLKGSTRNRHVQSTGKENEVLLDENLVETAHLAPFYLREHSKRILRGALYNDTKFLADTNVMDYSLVVGIDKESNELVVGIVDYIRTYTWDKKLESWVKESAFLGGAGKGEPTIVTPKQYRQRFITAMERYFPLIPDRWMKQKDTPEEDPNCFAELWPDW